MMENNHSVKIFGLERKIEEISTEIAKHRSAIGKLEAEKAHWKFVLDHIDELQRFTMNSTFPVGQPSTIPAPTTSKREPLSSVTERRQFIVNMLRESGKEIPNYDIFKAQIDAGLKVTKFSHDGLLSKLSHEPGSHIERGSKQGMYRYAP
jgi:hypothetical protein